ncbi:MAG: WS/DGAT/MGAT family O-acyltransferase [Actinomycetota bacterium]
MERLSALDATFLYFETPSQHQHVCAVLVLDPSTVPGGYTFEKIKNHIGSRLHLLPPFRRKLMTVPLNFDHPIWVETGDFDLDYHVRRVGLPSPGTEEQLAELAADIAGRQLDRRKPLWEMWVVEGLENGHAAIIAKMHHCTVDGVSGANMMVHLLDLEPGGTRPPPDEWTPEHAPSEFELIGRAILRRIMRPMQMADIARKTIGSAIGFIRSRRSHTAGMPTPFTAPRTPFNVSITPHRIVAFTHTQLEDIKVIKRAFGTTVNDVVLAVCSGALRRYLDKLGEHPQKSLMAVVPVSVRTDEEKDIPGSNRVSAMFTSLASNIDDPVERLYRIQEVNKGAKEEHNAIGAGMLQDWARFAAPTTFSLAARLYAGLHLAERMAPVHNLVISNVPGPPFPLYFGGAKMVGMYPLGPVFHGAALNMTIVSYQDIVCWGMIACRESLPGLWDLAAAIPEALAELLKAAEAVTPA